MNALPKTLAALVLMAALCGLAACANDDGAASQPAPESAAEETVASAEASEAEAPEVEAPAAPEVYALAIDPAQAPAQRRDSHSDWLTIDEEICAAVANDQDFRIEYTYFNEDPDDALAAAESGEVAGVVGGVAITDDAKTAFDFSDPYFEDADGVAYGLAVPKGQSAELLEVFNAGLADIKANGKYEEIMGKY